MSRALVFGEIIWDIFGDDYKIGGAPFNLAAHMSGLSTDVYMVSALGKDELGKKAREHLAKWGIKMYNL